MERVLSVMKDLKRNYTNQREKKNEAFTSNLVHIQSKSIREQGNQSDTEEKASRKRKEVKHNKDV